jgi:protein-disulfide isomerase
MKLSAPLAAAVTAALALSACQKQADAEFGAKVRAYLLEHPEVLQEMAVKLREKEQLAQTTASKAAVQKFRAQLERDPRDVVINPGGSITVVEFFDFNCGYCKLVAPEVVKLVEENPDVRLVLKQFAFQTEDAVAAAKVALTEPARPKALALYRELLAQKPLDAAAIDRSLVAVGLDPAATRAAGAAPAIERQIQDAHALAGQLKIEGTPAFVVGDQVIHGADIEALRAAVAAQRAGPLKRPPAAAPGSPT